MRSVYLIAFSALLSGCQNLQSPDLIVLRKNCADPASLCFLRDLANVYRGYDEGAQDGRSWTDGTVLGATGGAVIGAATNAHSDLYKATGGIALTALGFSKYANYKNQSKVVSAAATKLICASAPLESLLRQSGEFRDDPHSKVDLTKAANRLIPDIDLSGENLLVDNAPTTVKSTDSRALGQIYSTYAAVSENAAKAQKIQFQINNAMMKSLAKLQLSVRDQIENDSFKLDEAVQVIKPAATTPKLLPSGLGSAFVGDKNILDDDAKARKIIYDYNALAACMGDDFVKVDFD